MFTSEQTKTHPEVKVGQVTGREGSHNLNSTACPTEANGISSQQEDGDFWRVKTLITYT